MTVAQDQGDIWKPPKSPLLRLDPLTLPQFLQTQLQGPGIEVRFLGLTAGEGVLEVAGVAQQPGSFLKVFLQGRS